MELNIDIKRGLGTLLLGMPVEEVQQQMGTADSVESIQNAADEPSTVLHYNSLHLTLFFEGETPTLHCIDISHPKCTLFGAPIFNMKERDIVTLMVEHNYLEQDIENEDWGERRITFYDANIDFYFDEGKLCSIVFGK